MPVYGVNAKIAGSAGRYGKMQEFDSKYSNFIKIETERHYVGY